MVSAGAEVAASEVVGAGASDVWAGADAVLVHSSRPRRPQPNVGEAEDTASLVAGEVAGSVVAGAGVVVAASVVGELEPASVAVGLAVVGVSVVVDAGHASRPKRPQPNEVEGSALVEVVVVEVTVDDDDDESVVVVESVPVVVVAESVPVVVALDAVVAVSVAVNEAMKLLRSNPPPSPSPPNCAAHPSSASTDNNIYPNEANSRSRTCRVGASSSLTGFFRNANDLREWDDDSGE